MQTLPPSTTRQPIDLTTTGGILLVFVIELAVRFIAHGSRPQDFFRDGWNVFDFIVVTAALVPGWQANSTIEQFRGPGVP